VSTFPRAYHLESWLSLKRKRVTPHVFRHTTAMNMPMAGVDTSVIALWLGHESIQTTQIYLQADLKLKEQALSKASFPEGKTKRFHANDRLLEFLEQL
jgi:site-specific recombinase XerD